MVCIHIHTHIHNLCMLCICTCVYTYIYICNLNILCICMRIHAHTQTHIWPLTCLAGATFLAGCGFAGAAFSLILAAGGSGSSDELDSTKELGLTTVEQTGGYTVKNIRKGWPWQRKARITRVNPRIVRWARLYKWTAGGKRGTSGGGGAWRRKLACTRYWVTSSHLCTNQSSVHSSGPAYIGHTVAILLHGYWAIYDPLQPPPLYAI